MKLHLVKSVNFPFYRRIPYSLVAALVLSRSVDATETMVEMRGPQSRSRGPAASRCRKGLQVNRWTILTSN